MKTNSKRTKAYERFVITFITSLLLGAGAYGGYGYLEGSGQLETLEYQADTIPERVASFVSVAAAGDGALLLPSNRPDITSTGG